jgi:Leucine-rich repeat (LRR) protein
MRAFFAVTLVVWSLVAIGCGGDSSPSKTSTPQQKLAKDALLQSDETGKVLQMSVIGLRVKGADMGELSEFPDLQELTLQECGWVTDDDLKHVAKLANLRKLALIRVPVTDDGLAHLKTMSTLRELQLVHTKSVGKGLAHLKDSGLEHLEVHGKSVTNEGLSALSELLSLRNLVIACPSAKLPDLHAVADLKQLESLDVSLCGKLDATFIGGLQDKEKLARLVFDGEGLTDELLDQLCHVTLLQELDLTDSKISDNGLLYLERLANLRKLDLSGCKSITDDGLRNLAGLSNLEELNLTKSGVTGQGFSHLKELEKLRQVILSSGQINSAGSKAINDFKRSTPNCNVDAQPN